MIRPDRLVDEVHPGLWIGGSWAPFPSDTKPFDIVLTVCHRVEARQPAPVRIREFVQPLDDIQRVDVEAIDTLADAVTTALGKGLTVLVRCAWGLNRSALVAGAAIARITNTAGGEVVAQLRAKRSPDVLFNRTFERHLRLLAPERTPDVPPERIAWRTWKLTTDADGPALTTAYVIRGRTSAARFVATCDWGHEPPGPKCTCGMYVMPTEELLRPWVKDVVGQVVTHGTVLPGHPDWIGKFPGEYRASAVTLNGIQHLAPKFGHLAEPLSERYGVPFEVRAGRYAEPLNETLLSMIAGARVFGLRVDMDYLNALPSDRDKQLYLGFLLQGRDMAFIKSFLRDGRSGVAA